MSKRSVIETLRRIADTKLSDPDEEDFGGDSDDDDDDDDDNGRFGLNDQSTLNPKEYPGNSSDQEPVDYEDEYDPDERYTLDLMRTNMQDIAKEAARKLSLYDTNGKDPFIQFVTNNTALNTIEATRIFFLMDAHCDIGNEEKAMKYILGNE
jgi:hypothetical protein